MFLVNQLPQYITNRWKKLQEILYYSVNKMKFPFQIMITDLNTENCEELFTAYAMNKTRHTHTQGNWLFKNPTNCHILISIFRNDDWFRWSLILAFILDRAAYHHRYKCFLQSNIFISCSLLLITIDICVSRWIRLAFVYKTCVNWIKLPQFMVVL